MLKTIEKFKQQLKLAFGRKMDDIWLNAYIHLNLAFIVKREIA